MGQIVEISHKSTIAHEIKYRVSELNELIEKARRIGLIVEVKDKSNVMAANIPPLQVTIFERKDY